jgi:hypothetical protein
MRNAYKILSRKSERKRPFGKHMCRLEDNIKVDRKDKVCEDVDSTGSGYGPVAVFWE